MSDRDEEFAREWYDRKSILMEDMLGKEHDMVMHALIPYCVGGGLDLYYYPNGLPGTAIATKELSESPGEGSSNDVYRCYELVMFTRHQLEPSLAMDDESAFGRVHATINSVLGHIGPYSAQACLNPNETCEFPADTPRLGGRCLLFDGYPSYSFEAPAEFGLLALIEIFRSEMDYARTHGGEELISRLKWKGHYPYSDMDRKPVA